MLHSVRDFSVSIGSDSPWLLVSVRGELDLGTVPLLEEAVTTAWADRERLLVVLDLSELTFCDSSGLSFFIRTHRELRRCGGKLALLAPPPGVAMVLERTGVGRYLTIWQTLADGGASDRDGVGSAAARTG